MSNPMNGRRQELARADAGLLVADADGPAAPAFHLHIRRSLSMHRALAAGVAAFVLLVLVVWALTRKPMYTAESLIYVEPLEVRLLNDGSSSGYDPSRYDSYLQQQVQTVERADTLEAALGKMPVGVWSGPGESIASATRRLGNALKVDRVLNSYQLSIDVSASNPRAAAAAANAVTLAYLEEGRKDEHARADTRLQLLTEEAQRISEEMTQDKAEQASLGKSLGVANPSGPSGNPYDLQSEGLRTRLAIAREAHDAAAAQLASVSVGNGAGLSTAANELILTDPSLVSIKQTLSQRRALLSDQMAGLTPGNPVYKQDLEETAALDRAMDRATQEARERAERQLQEKLRLDLRRTGDVEGRLNGQLAEQTARATGAGPKLQRASELETDLHRLTSRFAAVDDAIRGLQLETGGPGQAHLALAARVPDAAQPNRSRLVLLLALPFALLCGIAAAVIANKWDQRLYVGGDVQEVLGFAPMCVLPQPSEVSEAAYDEFLLRLAGGIEGAYRHGGARSFVVTPVSIREDARTLLPQLCTKLRQIGFRAISVGAEELMPGVNGDIGSRARESRLRLHTAHALEGFGASRVERLLQDFSLVLIQAPPLLGSALTEYVVRCADATILLVESGRTNRSELRRAALLLERLNPQGIGAVLEDMPMRYADSVFQEAVRAADRSPLVMMEPAPQPERRRSTDVAEADDEQEAVADAARRDGFAEPFEPGESIESFPAEEDSFEDVATEAEFAEIDRDEAPISEVAAARVHHEEHGKPIGEQEAEIVAEDAEPLYESAIPEQEAYEVRWETSEVSGEESSEAFAEPPLAEPLAEIAAPHEPQERVRESWRGSTSDEVEEAEYEDASEAELPVHAVNEPVAYMDAPQRDWAAETSALSEESSFAAEPQRGSPWSDAVDPVDPVDAVEAEQAGNEAWVEAAPEADTQEEVVWPHAQTQTHAVSLHEDSVGAHQTGGWASWHDTHEAVPEALPLAAEASAISAPREEALSREEAAIRHYPEKEPVPEKEATTESTHWQETPSVDPVGPITWRSKDRREAKADVSPLSHEIPHTKGGKAMGWVRRLLGRDDAPAPVAAEGEKLTRAVEAKDSSMPPYTAAPLLTYAEGGALADYERAHHAGDIVFSESASTPVRYESSAMESHEESVSSTPAAEAAYSELPDNGLLEEAVVPTEPAPYDTAPAESETVSSAGHFLNDDAPGPQAAFARRESAHAGYAETAFSPKPVFGVYEISSTAPTSFEPSLPQTDTGQDGSASGKWNETHVAASDSAAALGPQVVEEYLAEPDSSTKDWRGESFRQSAVEEPTPTEEFRPFEIHSEKPAAPEGLGESVERARGFQSTEDVEQAGVEPPVLKEERRFENLDKEPAVAPFALFESSQSAPPVNGLAQAASGGPLYAAYAPPAGRQPLHKWKMSDELVSETRAVEWDGTPLPAQRPGLAKAMRYVAQDGPPARASEGLTAMRAGAGLSKAVARQEASFRPYSAGADADRIQSGMSRRWAMLSRFERNGSLTADPDSGEFAGTATAVFTDRGGEPHV